MNQSILKRILAYTKPYIGYFAGSVISAVLSVALTLLAPVLIGDAIDFIVGAGTVDFESILPILGWLALSIFLAALFQWVLALCNNTLTQKTVKSMRIAVFNKLNSVPLKYIDAHAHGDLNSRVINDMEQIGDGLLQGFTQLFTGVITILGTLIFMLSINVTIAITVVILTPVSLFVASFIAKRSHNSFAKQSKTRGELGGYAEEMISNQKVVKAFCYENRSQKTFEEINHRLYESGVKSQFYSSMTNPCTRFVNGLVYAAVGIIGAVSALSGRLSIGQISCFLTYANQYTKPFNEISGVITELQTAFASARRIFQVLDEPSEPVRSDALEAKDCKGKVDMKNVSFSYRQGVPLIEHLNLSVSEHQKIAIVGPTGCGKTTVINLLMRFYDVKKGEIAVDGTDIRKLSRNSLRRLYGMVLQETWLFHGTVRENIAYEIGRAHV